MLTSKTIVINSAGMGSRLGFGYPKSLLNICGKPLIYHHLEATKNYKDVRIVIGHQAEKMIRTVRRYRNDVLFVFNHQYQETNTLKSLSLGSQHANHLIVSLDGDLLVHPQDLSTFLQSSEECVGYTQTYTDEPVYAHIISRKTPYVTSFSRKQKSPYEWTGLLQIYAKNIRCMRAKQHVYHTLRQHVPIKAMQIRCVEIDTPREYENALRWAEKYLTKNNIEGGV